MGLSHIVTILGVVALTTANINITSPPITNWGNWGYFERCPFGRYAQGFQLKTEPNQLLGDDTALNAIIIHCGDPYRPDTATLTSTVGDFGEWGNVYTCYPGVLTGFQLRVESERPGSGDDTATNNIRFYCSTKPNEYIEGDGMSWGEWSQAQHCYGGQAICGIQTQVEPYLDSGDDTMLNNVRFECCDYNEKELVKQMENQPPAVLNPKLAPLFQAMTKSVTNNTSSHHDTVNILAFSKAVKQALLNAEKSASPSASPRQTVNIKIMAEAIKEILQAQKSKSAPVKEVNIKVMAEAVKKILEQEQKSKSAPVRNVNIKVLLEAVKEILQKAKESAPPAKDGKH